VNISVKFDITAVKQVHP